MKGKENQRHTYLTNLCDQKETEKDYKVFSHLSQQIEIFERQRWQLLCNLKRPFEYPRFLSKSICTFNPNFLESAVSVAFLTNDSLRATFVMKDTKVFRQADGRSCLPFMPLGRGEGGRDGDRARIALDCAPRGVSDAIRRFFCSLFIK